MKTKLAESVLVENMVRYIVEQHIQKVHEENGLRYDGVKVAEAIENARTELFHMASYKDETELVDSIIETMFS
jgi:hypothetical protein